ncbi:carboxypeptidase-like regulatory domain-containing protein [Catellatospora vulcania]|uniref:carboxypeptidase-like regulatory domain-containing protein n=1 Tax=Catellatospora vulcania TaxID=1460450 RepID=UPI0012D39271|nr:carboxypeptidase-like regulatory domain-containing protein [Catellatospora vulcania]
MRRTTLRRLGSTLLAVTVAIMGLATPAHADPGTGAISGHLTDNGSPVANAWVSVWGGVTYRDTTTDADGYYRVTDLPPGTDYRVIYYPPGRPNQYAYQSLEWEGSTEFTVVADTETVVDDSLFPVGFITGRFTTHTGEPLLNGSVELRSTNGGYRTWAETDADGRYTAAAPAGTYKVGFSSYWTQQQWVPGQAFYDDGATFTVTVGQTLDVSEAQTERAVVTGHITRPDGAPAASASVSLSDVTDRLSGIGASTDENGAYRIEALPGQYRIVVTNAVGEQYVPQQRYIAGATVFDLVAGVVTTVDETQLGLPGSPATMRGRLVDAAGHGVPDVEVRITSEWGSYRTATTNTSGDWTSTGMTAGVYTVRFSSPAHQVFQYAYGKAQEQDATRFTLQSGQTLVVNDTVIPATSIRITAKDAATAAALDAFDVSLGQQYVTAEHGVAVLLGAPAGQVEVAVHAPGYRYQLFPVTVTAGQTTELEVSLTPYAHITTKVVDAVTGEPLAGVCVFPATRQSFRTWQGCPGESGPDGTLTLDHVDPGTMQLFVLPAGGSPYGAQWFGKDGHGTGSQQDARSITLAPGETRQIQRIKMDRAGTVTGVVTGADGQPVTGGVVSMVTPTIGNGSRGGATIDSTGHYTIGWLGPYQWPLQFRVAEHAWQWSGAIAKRHDAVKVPVAAEQTTVFDQQLKRGTQVRVTVTGGPDGGEPAAFNVATGDLAAIGYAEQSGDEVSLLILHGQQVRFQYSAGNGDRFGWYGGTGFATATNVPITPTGPATLTYAYS